MEAESARLTGAKVDGVWEGGIKEDLQVSGMSTWVDSEDEYSYGGIGREKECVHLI